MRVPRKEDLLARLSLHRQWLKEEQQEMVEAEKTRQQRLWTIQDIRRQLQQYYGE